MKNIFFILSLSITAIVILGILFVGKSSQTDASPSAKTLLHVPLDTGSGSADSEIIYAGPDAWLALADSIYTLKDTTLSILSGATQVVNLTSGVALFSLENQFTPLQIASPRFTIDHWSKGLYYVDVRSDSSRIYSLTALLRIIIRDPQNANITSFTLLPSQYFILDHSISPESMREADIFRLSQLQTLAIAPVKSEQRYKRVFGAQAANAEELFKKMLSDRTRTQQNIAQFSQSFREPASNARISLEKYGAFFVNDQKKRVIYQSLLVQKLQEFMRIVQKDCTTNCQKERLALSGVGDEIFRMKNLLESTPWANLISIQTLMKDYALLISLEVSSKNQAVFDTAQKILPQIWGISDQSRHSPFSELYTRYIFEDMSDTEVASNFQKTLGILIDSKQLPEAEFSGFVFFLKDYLSSVSVAGTSQITLFKQFIQIAKSLAPTVVDTQKRSATLALFFYSFGSISEHLKDLIVQEYFIRDTLADTELKPQFLSSTSLNIPADFIKSLQSLGDTYNIFDTAFKDEFQTSLGNVTSTLDSRSIANTALGNIGSIVAIFTGYSDYRTNISLGEAAKKATGLQIQKTPLSLAALTQYLATFSWVETDSIVITNDINVDPYYQVNASIYGRRFNFRLNPEGHIIEKIIINDWSTENRDYERMSLSIDARTKDLSEKIGSAVSSEERARFDIRNFFKYTFTEAAEPVFTPANPLPNENSFALTPQMKLFVQSELIEKDFLLLKGILNIPISRINAQIEEWEYKITLHDVQSSLLVDSRMLDLRMNSRYIFSADIHAFQNITFTVKNDQGGDYFGGSVIKILPQQIPTQDFARRWADLPAYFTRMLSLVNVRSDITLDLDARILTINGENITL